MSYSQLRGSGEFEAAKEGRVGTKDVSEAAPGFEPGSRGFADLCLTTWLCRLLSDGLRRKGEHYHSEGLTRVQGLFEGEG